MPWQYLALSEQHGLSPDINLHVNSSNVSLPCSDGVQIIYKILGDCVTDTQGILSDVFGILSILCWTVVSVPQMVKNCRHIEGVGGVSLGLILQWTLGDTTNLVGSILTQQLLLQIVLAVYFVFADLVLFSQYLYYQYWKRKHQEELQIAPKRGEAGPSKVLLCFTGAFLSVNLLGIVLGKNFPRAENFVDQSKYRRSLRHAGGRNLLSTAKLGHIEVFHNFEDEIGYAIGIVSSIFYVGSRSSQLYKNYKRKSTDGLSLLMFILAILGNLTYGLSILVRQTDAVFLIRHIPWLVGSLGVILLDASLVVQFKYYGSEDEGADPERRRLLEGEVAVYVESSSIPNYQSASDRSPVN